MNFTHNTEREILTSEPAARVTWSTDTRVGSEGVREVFLLPELHVPQVLIICPSTLTLRERIKLHSKSHKSKFIHLSYLSYLFICKGSRQKQTHKQDKQKSLSC